MFMRKTSSLPPIAVRTLELSHPIQPLLDITGYARAKIYVLWAGRLVGPVEIENWYQPLSVARLQQAIADNLALKLLALTHPEQMGLTWPQSVNGLVNAYLPSEENVSATAGRRGVMKRAPTSSLFDQSGVEYQTAHKQPELTLDLSQPLPPLLTLPGDGPRIQVKVVWQGQMIGTVELVTPGGEIASAQVRDAIVNNLALQLIQTPDGQRSPLWAEVVSALAQQYLPAPTESSAAQPGLPAQVSVSIVIATLDRPDDLRHCLRTAQAQQSPRRIELVVVDNNPASGLTPPVVAEFPGVILVNETRRGLAYARNAGFVASTGDIAIATDDDVLLPPDWVERLVAPFARQDVMVVTGNVLPYELETAAQQYYELYGGLGRGFKRIEVNGEWFDWFRFCSVPTWSLGATANAAFRATIFTDPAIGLMEEALGPGMPSGVGEDTYLFYKVLKAGYTIVYEAEAYVWHKHRRTMAALRRQIYGYSKGGVSYHLTIALNDGDLRGLVRIFYELPVRYYLWRLLQIAAGRSPYPLSLVLLEIWGNLVGLGALVPSRWRVKREGRSAPYIPVEQRQPCRV